jgi:hypothetical protein
MLDLIRITISLSAIASALAVLRALGGGGRLVRIWAAAAGLLGLFFTHFMNGPPSPLLLPAGAVLGLAACLTTPDARFAALDDRQWRLLTLTRALFGALLLAAGAAGGLPLAFAIGAGLGDIFTALLALVVPGSTAYGGNRASRLLVFGIGFADFIGVFFGIVTLVMPYLAQHPGAGVSLLLPWVGVPLLVTLNVFGLRAVVRELTKSHFATA